MTVETSTSRMEYVGNGTTDTYPYTFKIFEDGDLVVIQTDTDTDVDTTLTITTDYTVTGAGEDDGGNVVLVAGDLATGQALTIMRVVDILQETVYTEGDNFPASSHENALDRLTMIAQQLSDRIDKCPSFPEGSTVSDVELPIPEDGMYLVGNEDGDGYENAELGDSSAITMTGMDTAGFIKNTAAGVFQGGQSILAAELPAATESAVGGVELATNAETVTGTDTGRATHPAGVAAAIADAALSAASQAEQETGTETGKYVAPGTQKYHATACKAWCQWVNNDTTINASYNVTSITDGTNLSTVNLTTAFSSVNYAVVAGCQIASGGNTPCDVEATTQAVGAFNILVNAIAGAATHIYMVAFGDQ